MEEQILGNSAASNKFSEVRRPLSLSDAVAMRGMNEECDYIW